MNKNLIDAKTLLRAIGLACTVASFACNLMSSMASDKREQIEIREAVAKEVQRQLALPMKGGVK
jgi:hypothetical protein